MNAKLAVAVSLAVASTARIACGSPFSFIIYQNATNGIQQTVLTSFTSWPTYQQAAVEGQKTADLYNKSAPQGYTYGYRVRDLGFH